MNEISATQKYGPQTMLICKLLMIYGEIRTKIQSKHLETITEICKVILSVKSNNILYMCCF